MVASVCSRHQGHFSRLQCGLCASPATRSWNSSSAHGMLGATSCTNCAERSGICAVKWRLMTSCVSISGCPVVLTPCQWPESTTSPCSLRIWMQLLIASLSASGSSVVIVIVALGELCHRLLQLRPEVILVARVEVVLAIGPLDVVQRVVRREEPQALVPRVRDAALLDETDTVVCVHSVRERRRDGFRQDDVATLRLPRLGHALPRGIQRARLHPVDVVADEPAQHLEAGFGDGVQVVPHFVGHGQHELCAALDVSHDASLISGLSSCHTRQHVLEQKGSFCRMASAGRWPLHTAQRPFLRTGGSGRGFLVVIWHSLLIEQPVDHLAERPPTVVVVAECPPPDL